MSSDAQAGTPPAAQDGTQQGGTPAAGAKDGSEDAQKWKEALKWKEKAEGYNELAKELEATKQQLGQVYATLNAGNNRATDPVAELRSTLSAQAEYDPASKAALLALRQNEYLAAENWLARELLKVPQGKQAQVEAIIRNAGYQMSAEQALTLVTDPETKTLQERLAEAEQTIERMKGAKPNGSSPAATVPATASASDDGSIRPEMKRSEYLAAIRKGGAGAMELMEAVGSNRTRLVDD